METPGAKDCYASRSLVPDRWLTTDTVAHMTEWTRTWQPGPAQATGYITLFAMGAANSAPRPDQTAYPHRAATFVIDIGTHWKPGTLRQLPRPRPACGSSSPRWTHSRQAEPLGLPADTHRLPGQPEEPDPQWG
ncbi:hypothetical protein [Streptomyces sp. NPDC021622]|uniref:hypothetical protein n=1 Tax=Streptomyces sp. NPDC021622 TaxID=3155013 RepID=UPI0033C28656